MNEAVRLRNHCEGRARKAIGVFAASIALSCAIASLTAQAADTPSTTELPKMTVHDTVEGDYLVTAATTGTKTAAPLLETPVTVDIVPSALIEDQADFNLKDALFDVPGVSPGTTLGNGTGFYLRGFKDTRVYRDGLLANSANDQFDSDFGTANVERIEVLKGPASILFGRVEPGGAINIVTKRPEADAHYLVQQSFGSFDLKRTLWDATGPIGATDEWLYRFSGSYEDAGSFRDFIKHQEMLFAPAVTWRPTDKIDWTVSLEGYHKDFDADFGIPAVGNRPAPIPISRNLGDPDTPISFLTKFHVLSDAGYRLSGDWSIRAKFMATSARSEETFLNPVPAFGAALEPDNQTLQRNAFKETTDQQSQQVNVDLTGSYDLGVSHHQILVGADYLHATTDYRLFGNYNDPDPALSIDIFSPVYGVPLSTIAADLAESPGGAFSAYEAHWYGIYLQDQITVMNRLHILGGGREDWATGGRGVGDSVAAAQDALPSATQTDRHFSPRVGVLYDLLPKVSTYVSWTNAFTRNNGNDELSGAKRPPETGEQVEVGAKTDSFADRLSTAIALYDLKKRNILQPDPANPFNHTILSGERRSRGIELQATGHLTDALSIDASYAYTFAQITQATDGSQGNLIANVPRHAASVWTKYEFAGQPPLHGLSLGLGIFYSGVREGDSDNGPGNTFVLPGYVRVDALASYRLPIEGIAATFQLNIKNLTDRHYYESTDEGANVESRNGIYPGAPRMILGSLKVEF